MTVKAAIYNPYWDSLGGGERYSAALARMLLGRGWQVDIWWNSDLTEKIASRFGIDISGTNFTPKSNFSDYDLVFWVSDGSIPTSGAKKTIIHFQFPFKNVGGHSLKNLIKSKFYKFIVNSQFTKSFIDKEFKVNSIVIYPPVDVDNITPAQKKNEVLYVGRFSQLTQAKGQETLITAFNSWQKRFPSWKLVLAGNTNVGTPADYIKKLKKLAAGSVQIVVNPNRDELVKLYSQAKLFWSASGYGYNESTDPLKVEHFGITVVEAMAAGCVPVITARGGHKEIVISGESGYIWEDLGELEKISSDLATNADLWEKLSNQAIERSKMFSTQVFEEKMSKLL